MPVYPGSVHADALLAATHFASASGAFTVDFATHTHSLLARNFNTLWCHALNQAEFGLVTHFAMLHGDIVPEQNWLDVLFDECERLDAHLVSAVSPIKTEHGLSSTGIDRPWMGGFGARRLSMHELYTMPETFSFDDTVTAGLNPNGSALLINTGCWIADLRKPLWWRTNAAGELIFHFTVNDRIIRNSRGDLSNQAESEDWFFSRRLAEHGAKYYCTRKVALSHIGPTRFVNTRAWGTQKVDGLQSRDLTGEPEVHDNSDIEKPLAVVQLLQFELGGGCNLVDQHPQCPSGNGRRWADLPLGGLMDDDTIVRSAVSAYRDLGFTGMVGWAYYNEPTLQADRMFCLMERIKAEVPEARFLLWTNGTMIPEECEAYRDFAHIIITGYGERSQCGADRLVAKGIDCEYRRNPRLDNRLEDVVPADQDAPCLRPFVEFVIDAYGNTHLCCYDWQGHGTWGNLQIDNIGTLARRWRRQLPEIVGDRMTCNAPDACRACGHRWNTYQVHDVEIAARARVYRASLGETSDETEIRQEVAV